MEASIKGTDASEEDPRFLSEGLLTCIGNKRALLPFLARGIARAQSQIGADKLRFLDLFAGSGAVSRLMKARARRLVCNDLELYARCVNDCYLADRHILETPAFDALWRDLETKIGQDPRKGFLSTLYAPQNDDAIQRGERVFYTRRNALYLDTARQHIAACPADMQKFFLGPLLVEASIHTNTGGVFKGFYKNHAGCGAFGGEAGHALARIKGDIALRRPLLSRFSASVAVVQQDAVSLARDSDEVFDLVYLDPPYNQHPYGSNYFMLNLIASYKEPRALSAVSGIPTDWRRSVFNKAALAEDALFSIVESLRARFFLLSYNSEGFIKRDAFIKNLRQMGKLEILETPYTAYRASRNLAGRAPRVTEYLFLLEKSGAA